jgi:hypothetical protein
MGIRRRRAFFGSTSGATVGIQGRLDAKLVKLR